MAGESHKPWRKLKACLHESACLCKVDVENAIFLLNPIDTCLHKRSRSVGNLRHLCRGNPQRDLGCLRKKAVVCSGVFQTSKQAIEG